MIFTAAPSLAPHEPVNDLALEANRGPRVMTKDLNTNLRFGFLVHDVSRLRRVVVDRALRPRGITRSQWWILAFLSRRDGMTLTALAADLDLTKVAVGKFVDRMEVAGFVERRSDQLDARVKRVYLTKKGTKLVGTIRESVDSIEAEIVDNIDDEALATAGVVLVRIKENLLGLAGGDLGDIDNGLTE